MSTTPLTWWSWDVLPPLSSRREYSDGTPIFTNQITISGNYAGAGQRNLTLIREGGDGGDFPPDQVYLEKNATSYFKYGSLDLIGKATSTIQVRIYVGNLSVASNTIYYKEVFINSGEHIHIDFPETQDIPVPANQNIMLALQTSDATNDVNLNFTCYLITDN